MILTESEARNEAEYLDFPDRINMPWSGVTRLQWHLGGKDRQVDAPTRRTPRHEGEEN